MRRLSTRAAVVTACALIVVTNLAILAAAALNRRGEPEVVLSLTERELAMPSARQDEGTSLELSLKLTGEPPDVVRRAAGWRLYRLPPVEYDWLDRAKLAELGFRLDLEADDPDAPEHYGSALPRRVYLVVEYDGDAWSRWIAAREEEVRSLRREYVESPGDGTPPRALADAEALLAADRTMRSRLLPVDAGLDAGELQRRYRGSPRHAVVVGLIRPTVVRTSAGTPRLTGELRGPIVSRVHVSRPLLPDLEPFLPREGWNELETRERREAEGGWPPPRPPRYDAVLAFGHRHEPWLVGVTRAEEP